MSVPIIGVEPALVGMLSAAESAGAATMAAGTSGAAPVMTTVLPTMVAMKTPAHKLSSFPSSHSVKK